MQRACQISSGSAVSVLVPPRRGQARTREAEINTQGDTARPPPVVAAGRSPARVELTASARRGARTCYSGRLIHERVDSRNPHNGAPTQLSHLSRGAPLESGMAGAAGRDTGKIVTLHCGVGWRPWSERESCAHTRFLTPMHTHVPLDSLLWAPRLARRRARKPGAAWAGDRIWGARTHAGTLRRRLSLFLRRFRPRTEARRCRSPPLPPPRAAGAWGRLVRICSVCGEMRVSM